MLRYQVDEIAAVAVDDPDEEEALRLEEERLSDAGALREAVALAAEQLDSSSGEGGALDLLGQAAGALGGHELLEDHSARLAAVAVEVSDLARTLRDEVEAFEDDPERLAQVQERRRQLAALRRKYGQDLRAVQSFAEEAALRLASLQDAEGVATRLGDEREEVQDELDEAEAAVRAVRAGAADEFGRQVEERLSALAMPEARLEVRVAAAGAVDPVALVLGANVGEPVQPLARVASGGELARAMLAIRLVGPGGPDTMVFDEVDAGVGGSAAVALGARAARGVEDPPGDRGHAPGPGRVASRRADPRRQARARRADGHHGDGGDGRGASDRVVAHALGPPAAATPPAHTPASSSTYRGSRFQALRRTP